MTFFDGFDMNAIAYAAPALAPAFHLDKVMIGNLFSIGLVGTTIGGFALGSLGDRIGRRPTIILAVASFGVLALGFALVRSYAALLAVRLVDGIASGGMLPVCWALNIEYAPRRWRATIVTVIMVGYSLGISLAGPIAIWLMPQFGWQSLFVFGGGLSLLAALLLLPTLPESIRYLALEGARPEAVARVLRRLSPAEVPDAAEFVVSDEEGVAKDFRPALLFRDELRWITLLWLAHIFSSMAVFVLATWTPLVLEALGFSRQAGATAGSITAVAGALGGLSLMRFTDHRGAIAITAMPLVAVPVLLIAGLVDLGQSPFFVAVTLIGFFVIGGHFGLHSIAGLFYPSTYRGNGAGWAISVAKIGSIAGPGSQDGCSPPRCRRPTSSPWRRSARRCSSSPSSASARSMPHAAPRDGAGDGARPGAGRRRASMSGRACSASGRRARPRPAKARRPGAGNRRRA